MKNISTTFFENVKKNPDKLAIICDGNTITYKDLGDMINRWANYMTANGVQYGDNIGILLPNNIEFVALIFAAAHTGTALVPLNSTLPASAITKAFVSSDVKHIIATNDVLESLNKEALPSADGLWLSIDDKNILDASAEYKQNEQLTGNEPLILTMTSGSTGEPKPIILTQKNKYDRAFAARELYSVTEDDIILAATPLYHSLAERLVIMPLIMGGTSVLMPRFSPSEWLKSVKEYSVSFTIAVSSQLRQIAEVLTSPFLPEIDSLRCIVSSSALLENHVKAELLAKLKCDFHECYGASEIAIASNLNIVDSKTKLKSVGNAAPGTDIKILGENGELLPTGEPGEIICKTPMLFGGYYKKPKLTQKAMYGEYFRTGDIGYLDEDGFLYFLDRQKDIIITGGINVYPKDVESVICELPFVVECAAFPFPDDRLGEIIAVAIVPDSESSFDQRAVRIHCANHLADFQQPRKYFIVDKLPRNNMGKLTKHQLVEQFALS